MHDLYKKLIENYSTNLAALVLTPFVFVGMALIPFAFMVFEPLVDMIITFLTPFFPWLLLIGLFGLAAYLIARMIVAESKYSIERKREKEKKDKHDQFAF